MEGGKQFLALLVFLQFYQGLLGYVSIQTVPELDVANPGEDISFMCRVLRDGGVSHDKIDICSWRIDGTTLYLDQNSISGDKIYKGEGLDKGDCGITIKKVDEKVHSNITCSLKPTDSNVGYEGKMRLIVAKAPQTPKLEVTLTNEKNQAYKEKDILSATCTVRDGRPAANITWFIGDEMLYDGLKMPVETCTLQDNKELCTIQQNLTRTLQASDDKKMLRCVAGHPSFKGMEKEANFKILVNYPPIKADRSIDFFGLVEGAQGIIPVTVVANPSPVIQWTIDGDTISEGTTVGRYEVKPTVHKQNAEYETVLIIETLTKEDTNKKYKMTAHNDAGETHYLITISTSPEPKVLEMASELIIIIVVAILLILLVLGGVLYTRAKGMLCFGGGDGEKRVSSPSSEGTENPAANHHSSTEYINELKKEKPKEDTPV